ncbi:MAG: hypothetical protein IJG97_06465 [Bacilli bacterium]|nr:hypothetical protein [Bacilli bacterium]
MEKILKSNLFKCILIILFAFFIIRFIDNKRTENLSRNYLSEKYNIPKSELVLKKVIHKHNERMCSDGECIGTVKQVIPSYAIFKYKNKEITVCENDDDFLYEDLFYGVRNYYANFFKVNPDCVFVFIYEYEYMKYLCDKDLKEITNVDILDFLQDDLNVNIVIELSENENDYYIMQRKKELRKKENVSTSKDKHIIKDDTGYDPWDRMDDAKLTVFKRYNIRTDYEY